MKKIVLFLIILIFILGSFYFFGFASRYTVPILVYHNIGNGNGSFYVSPENFARQMEYIKKHGYEVIALGELIRQINSKNSIKKNKVVITFDDGYRDNFKYAYPVLERYGFPATIFLITDFMEKYFPDSGKEFLNWDEVVIMSRNRISFGAHTKTHLNLGEPLDEKAALEEIMDSKKIIQQKTGISVDYFCYPSGAFCERAKKMIIDAGYKGALTTNRGGVPFNRDIYELKRIKVTNADATKPFSFWAKLSGYYNIFRTKRNAY